MALLALMSGMLCLAAGLGVVTIVTDLVLTSGRAQTGADAAALAAAVSAPLAGGDGRPGPHAAEAAASNGAVLLACCGDPGSWPPRVEVVTAARPRLGLLRRLFPEVRRRAVASLTPPPDAWWRSDRPGAYLAIRPGLRAEPRRP